MLHEPCRQLDGTGFASGISDCSRLRTVAPFATRLRDLNFVRETMPGSDRDPGSSEPDRRAQAVEAYYVRLLSEVSHDMRAPLGVILGAVGELEAEGMPELDAEQRLLLQLVRRSATRLAHYVANLLELSRLDSGRFCLQSSDVEVNELVRSVIAEVRAIEEGHPVAIEARLPAGELRARLDGTRVSQMLLNLVGHALRFASSRVEVIVSAADQRVRFAITQDSTSLAPEELQRNLDPALRNNGLNVDLGLAFAGAVVQAHGGLIHVEPQRAGGLRVTCELPQGAAPPDAV